MSRALARHVVLLLLLTHARALETAVFSWLSSRGGGASVAVGAGSDGLRGLITTRAAKPGDVLLEVPMACCLSDFGAGEAAVEPPSWTSGMEWTVQLACSVLAQRAANSPLLADWPEAPPVPLLCEADELSLACDEALASRVREQRLWALGQCALALGAAEAAADTASATTLAAPRPFLEALALVQSRALLLKIPRPIGMRHLLVPGLDLSNHAEQPSALYAFSPTRGGVVRLHATRWLEPGDAVTIRYGDFDNAHFAQQYGFVPASNKLHAVRLPLRCLLPPKADGEASGTATGTEGAEGELEEGGEEAEGEEAEGEEAEGGQLSALGVDGAERFELHTSAPAKELLPALHAVLTGRAVDPARGACACGDWDGGKVGGFGVGDEARAAHALRGVAHAAAAEARRIKAVAEAAEARAPQPASEAAAVLRALRCSNLQLLESCTASTTRLSKMFETAAGEGSEQGGGAGGGVGLAARMALEAAVMEAEPPPCPMSGRELEGYAKRAWDWEGGVYT